MTAGRFKRGFVSAPEVVPVFLSITTAFYVQLKHSNMLLNAIKASKDNYPSSDFNIRLSNDKVFNKNLTKIIDSNNFLEV